MKVGIKIEVREDKGDGGGEGRGEIDKRGAQIRLEAHKGMNWKERKRVQREMEDFFRSERELRTSCPGLEEDMGLTVRIGCCADPRD